MAAGKNSHQRQPYRKDPGLAQLSLSASVLLFCVNPSLCVTPRNLPKLWVGDETLIAEQTGIMQQQGRNTGREDAELEKVEMRRDEKL